MTYASKIEELIAERDTLRTALHTQAEESAKLIEQRDGLLQALKESRRALEAANAWPDGGGAIVDTIWYTATETLFDFMDAAIEKATN